MVDIFDSETNSKDDLDDKLLATPYDKSSSSPNQKDRFVNTCAFFAWFLDSDRSRSKKKKKRSEKQRSVSPINKRLMMFSGGADSKTDPTTSAFSYSKMFAGASTSEGNPGDYELKVNIFNKIIFSSSFTSIE